MRRPSILSPAPIALVAILGGAGLAHFAKPGFFDPIVPRWMPGSARLIAWKVAREQRPGA